MADEAIEVTEEETGTPRSLNVDERNKPILDIVGDQSVGRTNVSDLGSGQFDFTQQNVQQNELLTDTNKIVSPTTTDVSTATTVGTTGQAVSSQVTAPLEEGKAKTISAEQLPSASSKIPAAVNIDGVLTNQSQVDAALVQDTRTKDQMLSSGTLATEQTATLAKEATVEFQVGELYKSLEEGKPLPAWASANVRKTQEIMNARGLGASSVAAAAMVQAIAESALPIAVQDANKYATIQLQNLNNQQQTALANAATIATIDARNLSEVQALFSENAAENARLQFNAKSETQVNQFYDQLGTTVSQNNANRETATRQFNVDQANSMAKYAAKIEDARDKFNTSMQLQIDQSNALWRRTINTENSSGQNEQNRLNSAALLGLTTTAQNNLWQKYRDEASFTFQSTQNNLQRTHQLAQTAIANQFARDMFDAEIEAETNEAIGSFLGSTLQGVFSSAVGSLSQSIFG